MKNNLLFFIILHIALLLPITTLGTEPTPPSWYEKIYSYMPQRPNLYEFAKDYALFLALVAVGYAIYQRKQSLILPPAQQPENKPLAPADYNFSAYIDPDVNGDANIHNMIIFLGNAEWKSWGPKLVREEIPIVVGLPTTPTTVIRHSTISPLELFKQCVYPIILKLVQRSQEENERRDHYLKEIKSSLSEYMKTVIKTSKNARFTPLQRNDPNISNEDYYLGILKGFLLICDDCPEEDKKKTLIDAIAY